jgi:hypothetical protein
VCDKWVRARDIADANTETGIAASLIDGKTTHVIGSVSMRKDGSMTDESKAKLQAFWKTKQYLVIDEYSMISKTFLAQLSRNIDIGKQGSDTYRGGYSFGGVNVILCGDLHQFPPVAVAARESLFKPRNVIDDSEPCLLGRVIYEEFSTVVILKQQMRVTDLRWLELLTNLRHGRTSQDDIRVLRSLIIGSPETSTDEEDYRKDPWMDASLVTPRHAVRIQWNETAAREQCRERNQRLFICKAEDRVNGRSATLKERYCVAMRSKTDSRRRRKDLPWSVELAIGMKVLVTNNLETDLDLTNGARGEIVDIILHADEDAIGNESTVTLKYLPLCILVKLQRTRASQLEGLGENVIPVEAIETTMDITVSIDKNKNVRRTVRRRQFPITAAYGFTDYRSQGQTILYAIVDIANPPHGALSLFNLYVALSRSSGRSTIRLLRDFDEKVFMKPHDADLVEEDKRLEELNTSTKAWWGRMQKGMEVCE